MNPYKQKNIKIKEIKITQRKTLCVVIPECFYQESELFVFNLLSLPQAQRILSILRNICFLYLIFYFLSFSLPQARLFQSLIGR